MIPDLSDHFRIEHLAGCAVLSMAEPGDTNRLTRSRVRALIAAFDELSREPAPVIITGNSHLFSVGADLHEIAALTGPEAYEFSLLGQTLMNAVASHPAPVMAAIEGHCMGGGLDLALACHRRIAAPGAIFGHRGAALGLITGWGGTQRLPRLIGKGRALELFVAAEKVTAADALRIGLIDAIADDPVAEALRRLAARHQPSPNLIPNL